MIEQLDNIHYSFRTIDGYNKPFNIIISSRDAGKTTILWVRKVYDNWKKNHKPWLYLVRNANEIVEALLDDIILPINKFRDEDAKFIFNRGDLESGIMDIKMKDGDKEYLFIRILALSCKLRRIKLSKIKNIAGVCMDEYIIDPNSSEKYLKGEEMKIKEIYTTYERECSETMKMYFLGNPYSLFNPLFLWLGVDVNKLREGVTLVGDQYVVECYQLTEELKQYILNKNPLYKFDESYKAYAFDGKAVNDANIKIGGMPKNYVLKFVFRINKMNIGIFQNFSNTYSQDRFYCKEVKNFSSSREVITFEFSDLVDRCILISMDEKRKLSYFKDSFRRRNVVFSNINIYYLIEEIYFNL